MRHLSTAFAVSILSFCAASAQQPGSATQVVRFAVIRPGPVGEQGTKGKMSVGTDRWSFSLASSETNAEVQVNGRAKMLSRQNVVPLFSGGLLSNLPRRNRSVVVTLTD